MTMTHEEWDQEKASLMEKEFLLRSSIETEKEQKDLKHYERAKELGGKMGHDVFINPNWCEKVQRIANLEVELQILANNPPPKPKLEESKVADQGLFAQASPDKKVTKALGVLRNDLEVIKKKEEKDMTPKDQIKGHLIQKIFAMHESPSLVNIAEAEGYLNDYKKNFVWFSQSDTFKSGNIIIKNARDRLVESDPSHKRKSGPDSI